MTNEERKIRDLENVVKRLKKDRQTLIDQNHEFALNVGELKESLIETEEERDHWMNLYAEKNRSYEPCSFDSVCLECKKKDEQYHRIRSAFDRRKQQHQAIAEFFKHYHFTHKGQKMSLTKLIKFGQELQ
jgi:transcriptional regulator with GAF, ATPase, and Fis domain